MTIRDTPSISNIVSRPRLTADERRLRAGAAPVRYLVDDDAEQAQAAGKLLEGLTSERPGFVCREVTVELVQVLQGACGVPRDGIATVLEGLVATERLEIEATGRRRSSKVRRCWKRRWLERGRRGREEHASSGERASSGLDAARLRVVAAIVHGRQTLRPTDPRGFRRIATGMYEE